MKFIYSIFRFFLLFLLYFSLIIQTGTNVYATQYWDKYSNNPVINPNANWYHLQNMSLIKNGNTYLMLMDVNNGSGWRITKASSLNGITDWQIDNQPILSTGQWDTEHANPSLVFNPDLNIYQAWFSAYNSQNWLSGPNRFRIGYATSSATLDWQKYTDKWVMTGDTGTWDEGGIIRGLSIVRANGEYHMWYSATNSQNLATNPYWRIGYATSPDGINWTKYIGNPVISKTESWEFDNMMYPFVLYENGKFRMWYGTGSEDFCTRYVYAESTNGYTWTKPSDKNEVYNVTGNPGDFDRYRLAGHTRIRDGDMYKIWYSGFDGTHWSIGYATSSADPVATTPTPTPLEPIVIVPGMMASWNKEGILEGQSNPTSSWKLLPFVKEYDGLIQTLRNLGYQDGKNLFIWPYDWRKNVNIISQQLEQYIESMVKPNNPGSKIHLIGHSLGGLVARAWTQSDTHKDEVHHLVTVGTPAKGTIQPYKAWEGGDISQENSLLSLAGRIIIELNRRSFTTSRQAIRNQFLGFIDLLPTEPFLKKLSNNSLIPISDMTEQNTWLVNINSTAASIYPITTALVGTGFNQTPNMYIVDTPAWIDDLLGNWKDGKPVSQEISDGDTVVPSSRALFTNSPLMLPETHGNLLASSNGIKQILQSMEIPFTDSNITPGQSTTIQPGLLFLLRSPATLSVSYNGQTYTDFDGITFIPGASNGVYEVTVTGTATGIYRLAVGQFAHGTFTWKDYIGTTSKDAKSKYSISFTQSSLTEDPVTNLSDLQRLQEIDVALTDLSKLSAHTSITKARVSIKNAVTALSKKDFMTLKKQLEQILLELSVFRKSGPSESIRLRTFAVADTLVDAYQAILSKKQYVINLSALNRLQTLCGNEEVRINGILESAYRRGSNVSLKAQLLSEGTSYKVRADKTTLSEVAKKYILLFQTQIIFREIQL